MTRLVSSARGSGSLRARSQAEIDEGQRPARSHPEDRRLDYDTRLERGSIRGASESVLNAIALALQLNDVERTHLFDLARGTTFTAWRCWRRTSGPPSPTSPGSSSWTPASWTDYVDW